MKTFFILSLGRSGTAWLANLLNSDPQATVHHEPAASDHHLLGLSQLKNSTIVTSALLENRFDRLLSDVPRSSIYGEVNSYLRDCSDWLVRNLDATLVCVARDGRDFVASAYPRKVYTAQDCQLPIVPNDQDPVAHEWSGLTRFEQLAWYWSETNQRLLEIGPVVQIERILDDWTVFSSQILKPTGISIDYDTWDKARFRRINTSRAYLVRRLAARALGRQQTRERAIPRSPDWDDNLTNQFWKIAGKTMDDLGYNR